MAETQAEEARETPPEDQYNPAMLFLVSCVALATTAFIFSLRAAIMGDLEGAFAMDAETIGKATASAFLAFAIAIAVGSPMCDVVGMGNLLRLAAFLNIIGVVMVIFTGSLTGIASPFWILWLGMFLAGLGNYLRSEILFVSGLHPGLRPADLEEGQLGRLARETLAVARRSYRTGGVTLTAAARPQAPRKGTKKPDR